MSADHAHLQTQLGAFLDDELSPTEREHVAAHLAVCAACAAELRDLRQMDARLNILAPADDEFPASRVALASFRLRLREEPTSLPSFYSPLARTARRLSPASLVPILSLALVLVVALVLPRTSTGVQVPPKPSWSTFSGHLESPGAPGFRLDYPTGWSLSQIKFQGPLLASLRFSTYKPTLAFDAEPTPAADDAEVWLAFGHGSLEEGWPAEEVADLLGKGYEVSWIELAGARALRLTDHSPHFGAYDAVYLPVGGNFTLRAHLSATSAHYVEVFDRMLASLELGPEPTPTVSTNRQ